MYEIFVELLQRNNVTAYQVCKATGIAPATVSDWKNGKSTPKQDKLKKIADYFGVSLDYLTTGKESEAKSPVTDEDVKLALFGGDGEVTDAMWEEAMFAIELIKKRHQKKE
ncbi:MAG: helix-turn-helix domain-containing protein [Clostridia bacterium]|nr:helix-turn-helix domain-containing protein [Clostridia bacterium]